MKAPGLKLFEFTASGDIRFVFFSLRSLDSLNVKGYRLTLMNYKFNNKDIYNKILLV